SPPSATAWPPSGTRIGSRRRPRPAGDVLRDGSCNGRGARQLASPRMPPRRRRSASIPHVGPFGLPAGDEVAQRLVDALVEGRRLVLRQRLLPQPVGAGGGIGRAVGQPFLVGLVVGQLA